jgi:pyridoxal biosynthesis lyase PdxS
MAKVRIGHFVEAQILQSLEIDYIDESEVLTMADEVHHINKNKFKAPFVCGCRDLGEALRRIAEGATMLRTKVLLCRSVLQKAVVLNQHVVVGRGRHWQYRRGCQACTCRPGSDPQGHDHGR